MDFLKSQASTPGSTDPPESKSSASDTKPLERLSVDECHNLDGDVQEWEEKDYWIMSTTESWAPLARRGLWDSHDFELDDIVQGELGTCWWLATIGAIVRQDPDYIASLFTETTDSLGRRAYTVKLFVENGRFSQTQHCYVVNTRFPKALGFISQFTRGSFELWVALLEKALAAALGGYDKIDGGSALSGFGYLCGRSGMSQSIRKVENCVERIDELLTSGHAMTINTLRTFEKAPWWRLNLTESHVYVVDGVSEDKQAVRLYNPHGLDDGFYVSRDDIHQYFKSIQYIPCSG